MHKRMLPAIAAAALVVAFASPVYAKGAGAGKQHRAEHAHSSTQSRAQQHRSKRSGPESGTVRGKSPSTPDQDGIGMDRGIDNNDKTGPGTDGNNGCGNDPDREDDNNGWCGKPPSPPVPSVAPSVSESPSPSESPAPSATVLGVQLHRPAQSAAAVLGEQLARTGVAVASIGGAAFALMLAGVVLRRRAT